MQFAWVAITAGSNSYYMYICCPACSWSSLAAGYICGGLQFCRALSGALGALGGYLVQRKQHVLCMCTFHVEVAFQVKGVGSLGFKDAFRP